MPTDVQAIPLPTTLPTRCREVFRSHMELLPLTAVPELTRQVDQYLTLIREEGPAAHNPDLSLATIDRLATALKALCHDYPLLPDAQKPLVIAAVRYFLDPDDAADDLLDPLGFDDDLAVLNSVLLAIGRDDLIVTRAP
jgi:hypothetical protein